MNTPFLIASAAAVAVGLTQLAGSDAARGTALPDIPDMIRLEPAPFEHRIDGDWRRDGLSVDAPIHTVAIAAPIEIMAVPVSTGQWLACVADEVCTLHDGQSDLPDLPVVGVSWNDAHIYAAWLSQRTGERWRLPTDVEWAHAAAELFRDDAIGVQSDPHNPAVLWLAEYAAETARQRDLDREVRPVGSLNVNSLGVRDIGGAVWEWTSTCLRRGEIDGEGRIVREADSCGIYIAEGLHRAAITDFIRDPQAGGCSVGVPPANLGFRLVREL
ncbi:SUMF1/EgtB/PvdO family nonheme iron enzyme [Paracoccus albus]|uniref:SUMF1/EgtB/PvdO family nonheme iron enzyme n=1 Tax=Paracoccus albus TaxID=3017784 RepID=UPI0022F04936|nr:SUMF1/EgtB/PvdO family nonheme iron enzyme [Paracoccus albus]WBU58941.1 SUMF1/EgtB/PvdO family nonheme iron enzyme [Paracoccus albus]